MKYGLLLIIGLLMAATVACARRRARWPHGTCPRRLTTSRYRGELYL